MPWIEADRGYETPCYIWQGGRSGKYGYVHRNRCSAHRSAWIDANGPIPTGHHVHHLCLQPLCVRLEHLTLVSAGDHRWLHESGRKNRLSPEAINEIRTGPLSLKDVAAKYGISKSYASKVRNGLFPQDFAVPPDQLPERPATPQRSWNKGKTKLSAAAVRDIRESPLSLRKIGAKHGITATYASQIRRGLILGHL